jgi:hypothetical protein
MEDTQSHSFRLGLRPDEIERDAVFSLLDLHLPPMMRIKTIFRGQVSLESGRRGLLASIYQAP